MNDNFTILLSIETYIAPLDSFVGAGGTIVLTTHPEASTNPKEMGAFPGVA